MLWRNYPGRSAGVPPVREGGFCMTDKQEAAIEQITSHYTYDHQRDVSVEECAEFIQAVCKCKRGKPDAFDNFK